MPTPVEVNSLRQALEKADDLTFSTILRDSGYQFPPSNELLLAPNGTKLILNMPTPFARYLELTGYSVAQVRQRVIQDVCNHAYSNQDLFWAVFQSAGLCPTTDERIGATVIRKILFLAANPTDTGRLRLDKEVREVAEGLKRSNARERLELIPKFALKVEDLRRSLLDHSPAIVHFAGHTGGADGILTEDDQGTAYEVPHDALADLFSLCAGHVECVVLNACYSESQATAIAQHVPYVIGMSDSVSDDAAIEFAIGFYDGLGAGKTIEEAFHFGCNAIALKGIPEKLTPVLKKK